MRSEEDEDKNKTKQSDVLCACFANSTSVLHSITVKAKQTNKKKLRKEYGVVSGIEIHSVGLFFFHLSPFFFNLEIVSMYVLKSAMCVFFELQNFDR